MTPNSQRAQARTVFESVRASRPRIRLSALLSALALALLLAPLALAGPPSHVPAPAAGIAGFNHACGAAVDSQGNVYVSSAGESKIRIFDPDHTELASIANANEPCGLAVDSRGTLFVSEQAGGKVIRYLPDEYPFTGVPTYGPPETIDAGGEAKGIAVDTGKLFTNGGFPIGGEDSLYVAKGDHIDARANESRRVQVSASAGAYVLGFEGQSTAPLPFDASHAEVQAALEGLSTIGPRAVSVTTANFQATDHLIVFTGALGLTDVGPIEVDTAGLTGSATHSEVNGGLLSTTLGAGELSEATGVAAYSYRVNADETDRYLYAADAAGDEVKVFSGPSLGGLKLRRTIEGVDHDRDPETPEQELGFGAGGAYLAVDPGNKDQESKCASVAEQACTAGHLLVYDDANAVLDEFEASGEFLDQIESAELEDAEPTALAIDRSGGAVDGTIYATTGAGPGAELLAFRPLAAPTRPPLPDLSRTLATAQAVGTDPFGNVYVAAGSAVHVYRPNGEEIKVGPEGKGFSISQPAYDLAVDSACRVYVLVNRNSGSGNRAIEKVQYFAPSACEPADGTQFSGPTTVATGESFLNPGTPLQAITLNPANDHLFAANLGGQIVELDSADGGSSILDPCFGCGLLPDAVDIAVHGKSGNVYVSGSSNGRLLVLDPTGAEVLARLAGGGGPKGKFLASPGQLAVDQSNGHALVFNTSRGAAEEYDASGAFVAELGAFTVLTRPAGLAIDNSGGPGEGTLYLAYDDTKPATPDLWAFGPLTYGETPLAITGVADGLGAGNATLNGTVNPRGFELEECRFEYLGDVSYEENLEDEDPAFEGATSVPCAESLAAIGKGAGPVPVHADIAGLDLEARYRFRLIASNKYGPSEGDPSLFGPPLPIAKAALPVLYDEATLRGEVDPSGLATKYRFEYGLDQSYGQSTPTVELAPGETSVAVEAALLGLQEGTTYHFRIVAESEAGIAASPDRTFFTQERTKAQSCPNAEYRSGSSAALPECRAYELLTPAETRGAGPYAATGGAADQQFNNWLTPPRGPGAGESLSYFISGTLPGFDGTGQLDGYRARRAPGAHPPAGWANELISPSSAQVGGGVAQQHGVASDQEYWLFEVGGIFETLPQTLDAGQYLRLPGAPAPTCSSQPASRFELVGCGSLGADPAAEARFLTPGGTHVVFFSKARLEEEAAPAGTVALYDRAAGSSDAHVVSVRPDGSPFGAGESAAYVGASEDGSSIAFEVGGTLYLHRAGQTRQIASPYTFAGLSADGERIFWAAGSGAAPAPLYVCEVQAGPCDVAPARTEIAADAIFANVSEKGSDILFLSEEVLTGSEENDAGQTAQAGEPNLYAWNAGGTRFVAGLDPADLVGFQSIAVNLRKWTDGVSAGVTIGRAQSPTRATPEGEAFLFASHAQLTPYDNEGKAQIYRWEPGAEAGERLLCVSCDPSGAPPGGEASLQEISVPTSATTLIPNISDDGRRVFFQSPDRLLPGDANEARDVYEWMAQGTGGCEREGGCLALISSGQGDSDSFLYGMSADGDDVFFATKEKLVAVDVPGSPSIYDARVEGGIPDPPAPEACQGDACQGTGSPPPALPAPASSAGSGERDVKEGRPRPRCPKGKRKVRRGGKARCVKRKAGHQGRRSKGRADKKRRAGR